MNEIKQFIKSLVGFSIGPLLGAALGFISLPITFQLISPENYGVASIFQTYLGLFSILTMFGMDPAFTREYYQEKNTSKLLFNSIIVPIIGIMILSVLAIILISPLEFLMFKTTHAYGNLVVLTIIMLPFLAIQRFSLLILRMGNRGTAYSIISVLPNFLILIFNILFLLFVSQSFQSIIYSTFISYLIVAIVSLFITRDAWKMKLNYFDLVLFKRLFYFALPLIPVAIITWLFQATDRISLQYMSTATQVGIFAAASNISIVIGIVQTTLTNVWEPIAFRWYYEKVANIRFEKMCESIAILMLLVFISVLIGKELLPIILNESYQDAIILIPFLSFVPIMQMISSATGVGIAFAGQSKYNLYISIISLLCNIAGNFLLVPNFGAIGAVISSAVSYVIFCWLRILFARKAWYKFPIHIYVIVTLSMIILACCNTLGSNVIMMILNLVAFVIVCLWGWKYFKTALFLFMENTEGER